MKTGPPARTIRRASFRRLDPVRALGQVIEPQREHDEIGRATHGGCEDGRVRRAVAPLLAVTVALVLADSAVVTLALPDILRHLHTSVGQVAWVLIAFNLVLGLGAVPTAVGFARAQPRILSAVGIAVFAGSSAWCALAGSIEVLIAARCVQALGGALALVGCLELLVAEYGERRGVAAWVTAGVVGTATGPVAGGLLTAGVLVAGDLRGAGAVRGAGRAGRARRARRTRARAGPAPSGGAPQPDPRPAVGRAHGGAVPAGPAPGRGLAPLPGDRGADRVRRTGRGARRPPARPPPATAARGRGRRRAASSSPAGWSASRSRRRPTSPGRSRRRRWWASGSG